MSDAATETDERANDAAIQSDDDDAERLRRWRLILGEESAGGIGVGLSTSDSGMDAALAALYGVAPAGQAGGPPGRSDQRKGGLVGSAPNVARWLDDIRSYFPSSVVRVMQQDAMERLGLQRMLLEPELLEAVEPDIHLVGTILALSRVMPSKTRETARIVVRKIVTELEARLANPLRQAVTGSLSRAVRNYRPRHNEMDWPRTIRANLKHYQAELNTIIPERRIGFGRKGQALKEIILLIDQSGSMASSVVYAGILGAVLATIRAIKTSVVAFDTSVVDLTYLLDDPVDVLFGTQLGGGTDINRALAYSQGLIRVPSDTILVLISDLYEGGNRQEMLQRAGAIAASGVQIIGLLALSDDGAPGYDHGNASTLAGLGVPCFACTPDLFPDLMAAAIKKQDIARWAGEHDIVASRAE
jgi:Mg-chelatase subunit ChlD